MANKLQNKATPNRVLSSAVVCKAMPLRDSGRFRFRVGRI
jgi:hypothetical protein